jgi:hypothetical protein
MATFYVKTTGNASNSGSSDNDSPDLSGSAATVAASVVTLDGSPNLSALITAAGPTQSTIYINDATNSNQKLFKITAFDDTLKTVTVSVAPTGVASSAWRIGGRLVWTPANIEAALAAGDIVEFGDSPATRTTTYITCRTSGDSTSGPITFKGKTGVRPVLNVTNTSVVITSNTQTNWLIENLELDQDGATGNVISAANGWVIRNVKISDGGTDGINTSGIIAVIGCEITNLLVGHGINSTGVSAVIIGNYIHDVTAGNGITLSSSAPSHTVVNNIVDSNGGKGIILSGAATSQANVNVISGNTIYGNGDSGLEVSDADVVVILMNNIFSENGNAAGEYNVEWAAGTAELHGFHGYNVFYSTGGGGSGNVSGLTVNSTESTSNPNLTNPASGDFTINASSSAAARGYPGALLGDGTAYRDAGVMQRQVLAASGGNPIIGG